MKKENIQFNISKSSNKPLYEQLCDSIRCSILNREIEPGVLLPTIREISAQTQIAYATVSRAIRILTDEGVLTARVGSGIRVAEDNQPRPRKKTNCIGIARISSIQDMLKISPYYSAVFNYLLDYIDEIGYNTLIGRWSSGETVWDLFDHLKSVDALILLGSHELSREQLEASRNYDLPIICIGELEPSFNLTSIHSDNENDTFAAVSQMIKMGCERIAFSCAESNVYSSRLKGYQRALKDADLQIDPSLSFIAVGSKIGQNLIQIDPRPDALFLASGISLFPEALPLLYRENFRIGENLFVGAYDENLWHKLTDMAVPHLSVVQPLQVLAEKAVSYLRLRLNGGDFVPQIKIPSVVKTFGIE